MLYFVIIQTLKKKSDPEQDITNDQSYATLPTLELHAYKSC